MADAPEQGDLIWLEFSPQAGHEQGGHRPALVLSPRAFNAASRFAIVCPITSKVKGYPFEVELPQGSQIKGVVLSDQIKSLDWGARRAKVVSSAPLAIVDRVLANVALILRRAPVT